MPDVPGWLRRTRSARARRVAGYEWARNWQHLGEGGPARLDSRARRAARLGTVRVRVPRWRAACCAGDRPDRDRAGPDYRVVALTGSAYQVVFRNSLADPYLLGVAAGAGLGATVAISYAPVGSRAGELLPLSAFAGAILGVACAYLLGRSVGAVRTSGTLILAGVTVAAFMTAAQTFVQQQHTQSLLSVYSWLLGGFASADWRDVVLVTPYIAVSSAVLLLHRRVLDVISLGDE